MQANGRLTPITATVSTDSGAYRKVSTASSMRHSIAPSSSCTLPHAFGAKFSATHPASLAIRSGLSTALHQLCTRSPCISSSLSQELVPMHANSHASSYALQKAHTCSPSTLVMHSKFFQSGGRPHANKFICTLYSEIHSSATQSPCPLVNCPVSSYG